MSRIYIIIIAGLFTMVGCQDLQPPAGYRCVTQAERDDKTVMRHLFKTGQVRQKHSSRSGCVGGLIIPDYIAAAEQGEPTHER